ncbi:hypothetical protein ACJQWK_11170 [Exserohilum turcicum]
MSNNIQAMGGGGIGENQTHSSLDFDNSKVKSPQSISSGDTLHDGASDAYSSTDDALTLTNPASPESLNLNSLSIKDGGPRARKDSSSRYNHPFQRNIKQHGDTKTYSSPGRNLIGSYRAGAPNTGRCGIGGFRNAHTWMSPDAQEQQDFLIIRNSMRRLFKQSDVAKWKLSDYVAHREAMVATEANKLARQVKQKEQTRSFSSLIAQDTEDFLRRCGLDGNFKEIGNCGRVLGEQTIWCRDWTNGKEEVAPWPSIAEMKWEGDDRAKTGVGRFLPLPREDGPPGLMWNQLPVVEQYPMDQVCKIPTMEDVYLPIDYHIEPDHEYLWSKQLEQDMDALLET